MQPKISVSWCSFPYRSDLQGSWRPISWFRRCFLSSPAVFHFSAIKVTTHNPLLPEFVTSDPSYAPSCSIFSLWHASINVSAPWVSFLADRHRKSFSSSVLFSHFNWLHSYCHFTPSSHLHCITAVTAATGEHVAVGRTDYIHLYVQRNIYSTLYGPDPKLRKVKAKMLLRSRHLKVVLDGELGTLSPLARKD